MYASQISKALESDPHVAKTFMGVFPSDKLPKNIWKFPCSLVANTDPSSKRGEHWVCFYFDRTGAVEYFDSYGIPPVNHNLFNFITENGCNLTWHPNTRMICNDKRVQGYNSNVCGHYCIAYITQRVGGKSMNEIVSGFK